MAGHHVDHRRCGPLERDMGDVDAGGGLELLASQVRHAAGAGRCERDLARPLARERHQFLHAGDRQRRMRDEQFRHRHYMGHRCEVDQRLEGHLQLQVLLDDQRTGARQVERMAVGWRAQHELRRDQSVRAGAVVHQHRLAPLLRQRIGERAREEVGRATGRKTDHQPHRARRELLRGGEAGGQGQGHGHGNGQDQGQHRCGPCGQRCGGRARGRCGVACRRACHWRAIQGHAVSSRGGALCRCARCRLPVHLWVFSGQDGTLIALTDPLYPLRSPACIPFFPAPPVRAPFPALQRPPLRPPPSCCRPC